MSPRGKDDARVDRFQALGAAAFEQLGAVTPADDALLDRLVEHAIQAPAAPAPSTATSAASGKVGAKIVVALVLGGAVIAGAVLMRAPAEPGPVPVAAPTVTHTPPPEPPPLPEPPPVIAPPAPSVDPQPPPPAAVPDAPARPSKTAEKKTPQTDDPAALLLAANRARRADQPDQARALYHELAERFAGSREHRISQVALGDLELETYRRPARALEQYDAYLRAKPRGNLAEEALYGKARALDQLARRDDGTQAWSSLLERFPDSLHARAAKRRLGR